ncbi:CaiB/BaiF CoA transferase family protein [Parasphingopyxis marina]|uniref:CoA transferase n=1 Tax=Parasphingopyxis marina TaxID=2761622 RepID=A0A842HQP5_9SPHN|nr:CoA transferase [Parasphingopyxis marina]MBC2776068.1 CoA transferase [Parasphingopyxis marina]
MAGPKLLEGLRIVDMTSVIFGPYATQTLADCGADVIKVETPQGDHFRSAGKPAVTKGMGACHMTLNRGKRSIALDLRSEEDREVMQGLLADADVFIHNVRKSGIERLGFGYEDVKAIKPDIVYVHCTGFGPGGPYEPLQCYDDLVQAASGATSLMSRVDGDPAPRYIPSAIADKVAGLHGAYATMAALIHKLRTGEGQCVEVPMFEAFTQFLYEEHLFGATFDPPQEPILYRRQVDPDRQPFPTADGHVSLVPYVDPNWVTLFELLGDPEMLKREPFDTPIGRFRNQPALYRRIAELTPAKTSAEWTDILNAAGIPCIACRDVEEIFEDPHLEATGFFKRCDHPSEGAYVEMQPPVKFGARPDSDIRPAPRLDEHGADIRREVAERKPGRKAGKAA